MSFVLSKKHLTMLPFYVSSSKKNGGADNVRITDYH